MQVSWRLRELKTDGLDSRRVLHLNLASRRLVAELVLWLMDRQSIIALRLRVDSNCRSSARCRRMPRQRIKHCTRQPYAREFPTIALEVKTDTSIVLTVSELQ